jgi:hypothetical protein
MAGSISGKSDAAHVTCQHAIAQASETAIQRGANVRSGGASHSKVMACASAQANVLAKTQTSFAK